MYVCVYVFLEGRRHKFSAKLVSILTLFWEAPGSKNKKKEVPDRCEKRAPKTELQAGEKVTLGSAGSLPEASGGGGP